MGTQTEREATTEDVAAIRDMVRRLELEKSSLRETISIMEQERQQQLEADAKRRAEANLQSSVALRSAKERAHALEERLKQSVSIALV